MCPKSVLCCSRATLHHSGTTQPGFEATRFAAMTSWKRHNHTIRGANDVPGVGRLDIETSTSNSRTQSRRHLPPVLSTFVDPYLESAYHYVLCLWTNTQSISKRRTNHNHNTVGRTAISTSTPLATWLRTRKKARACLRRIEAAGARSSSRLRASQGICLLSPHLHSYYQALLW